MMTIGNTTQELRRRHFRHCGHAVSIAQASQIGHRRRIRHGRRMMAIAQAPQIYRTVYHRHRSRGMSVTEASQENRRVNDRHGCRGVSVAQTAQIHRTIDDGHGSSGVPIGQTAQIYRTIDNRHSRCGMPIAHTAMISRNRYYIVGCFCHTVGHTSYKRSGRFGRGTYGPGGASTAIDPTLSRPLHSVGQTERSQIHVFIGIPTCRSGRFSSRKNIKGKFGCLFHLLRIKQGIIQDYFFE